MVYIRIYPVFFLNLPTEFDGLYQTDAKFELQLFIHNKQYLEKNRAAPYR